MDRRALLSGLSLAALFPRAAGAQSALGVPAQPVAATPAGSQAPKLDDTVTAGLNRMVIARWGDPVLPNAPPFDPHPLTGPQADTQFPYDAVIVALLSPPPAQDGIPRLVMVLVDPTAPARMVFPGGVDQPDVAGRLQGATILNLQFLSGRWKTVDGGYQSRRLAEGTLCQISGTVTGAIGTTVQGILAPAAGCPTPWGNVLLAEGATAPWLARLAQTGFGYADPTDATRFGWVAELNAQDPGAFPIKRTALGRFARAGVAATTTADGHAVIFMTQADPAGFLFRFIAATTATDGTALDSGTLSVAQITGSGITWLPLGNDTPTLVAAASAAATAGASPFDAPGGIAIAPGNGAIYLACGGNTARTAADALNPRVSDDNGHIIVLAPPNGDVTAKSYAGSLAIVAGDPASAQLTQYTAGANGWLKKPRTLNLDSAGQLWIGTDQDGATTTTADGLFIMQTGGPSRYLLTTAYLAPVGAAIGGAAFDVASKTVFAMVRHPGATPGASFDAPATRWPTLLPGMPPQSTCIALTDA
jgi:secreted PhoX family phosphatase